MIDLKKLNVLVQELNKYVPKKDSYSEEDLMQWATAVGVLSFISNEALYLIGDISKVLSAAKAQSESENVKSVNKNSN